MKVQKNISPGQTDSKLTEIENDELPDTKDTRLTYVPHSVSLEFVLCPDKKLHGDQNRDTRKKNTEQEPGHIPGQIHPN